MNLRLRGGAVAILTTSVGLIGMSARAADLEIGQQAPDFSLPDQTGKIHHLADYRGKTVILAFYPKDFTGG